MADNQAREQAESDTSAFLKLVLSEPGSRALRAELAAADTLVSSSVLLVESRRAAARYGPLAVARTRAALATVTMVPLDDATLEHAADLKPAEMRSPPRHRAQPRPRPGAFLLLRPAPHDRSIGTSP